MPTLKPAPLVREALGTQVAHHLRDAIVRGALKAGQRLVETELADTMEVSRGPVRDALRILETEGLVAKRGQGVVVLSLEAADIEEIYSLRTAMESLTLGITMTRTDALDVEPLRRAISSMETAARAGDTAEFSKADLTFHALLCDLSGHRRATAVWRQYEPITLALLRVTVKEEKDLAHTAAKHQLLLDLVLSGEAGAAQQELEVHLDGAKGRMLQAWRSSRQG